MIPDMFGAWTPLLSIKRGIAGELERVSNPLFRLTLHKARNTTPWPPDDGKGDLS
jgi:hypothetical protein